MLPDGRLAGHWTWGTTLYTAVLATVLGKAALITEYVYYFKFTIRFINNQIIINFTCYTIYYSLWTKYTYIAIPGSFIFWLVFIVLYGLIAPKIGISEEYQGIVGILFTSPVFYATILLVPIFCLLRDYGWK